jgi:acyl-CoA synthetase (AMP-forming)/AMP-acid ligase II
MSTFSDNPEFVLLGQKGWQHARPPPDGVWTLPDLFAHTVTQHPHRPALSCSSGGILHTLSYFDLARKVRQISDVLQEELPDASSEHAPPVVGIWLERSADLTVAVLAATTAGFTWLPFDPDAPVYRVKACLDDSNATLILCDDAHYDRACAISQSVQKCRTICFSDLAAPSGPAHHELSSATRGRIRPDDPAYLIYTSGSKPQNSRYLLYHILIWSASNSHWNSEGHLYPS